MSSLARIGVAITRILPRRGPPTPPSTPSVCEECITWPGNLRIIWPGNTRIRWPGT